MGDVELNVQRHVKTQPESSRLVYILTLLREWDKVMQGDEICGLKRCEALTRWMQV